MASQDDTMFGSAIGQPMEKASDALSASSSDVSCLSVDGSKFVQAAVSLDTCGSDGVVVDGEAYNLPGEGSGKEHAEHHGDDGNGGGADSCDGDVSCFSKAHKDSSATETGILASQEAGLGEVVSVDEHWVHPVNVKNSAAEAMAEGSDDSTSELFTAEKVASIFDGLCEDILSFSPDDIAGPINLMNLPLPTSIDAAFPEDVLADHDLGEVMDWEALSLPDIYDFCSTEATRPPRGRNAFKRKTPPVILEPISVFLGPVPVRARSKRRSEKQGWKAEHVYALTEKLKRQIRAPAHLLSGESFTFGPHPWRPEGVNISTTANDLDESFLHMDIASLGSDASGPMREGHYSEAGALRRCSHCSTTKTPQWRAGPNGPKTLCNACGVRFKSGRLCSEYRPASSPEFEANKHSNSHRKIVEMRKLKEQGIGDGTAASLTLAKCPVVHKRIKKTALQPRKPLCKAPEPQSMGDILARREENINQKYEDLPVLGGGVETAKSSGDDQPVSRISVRMLGDGSVETIRTKDVDGTSWIGAGKQSVVKVMGDDVLTPSPSLRVNLIPDAEKLRGHPPSPCTPDSKHEMQTSGMIMNAHDGPVSQQGPGGVSLSVAASCGTFSPEGPQQSQKPLMPTSGLNSSTVAVHQKQVKQGAPQPLKAHKIQGLEKELTPAEKLLRAQKVQKQRQMREQQRLARLRQTEVPSVQQQQQHVHLQQQLPPQHGALTQALVAIPFPQALPKVPLVNLGTPVFSCQQHQLLLQQQLQPASPVTQEQALQKPQLHQHGVDQVVSSGVEVASPCRGSLTPVQRPEACSMPSSPGTPEGIACMKKEVTAGLEHESRLPGGGKAEAPAKVLGQGMQGQVKPAGDQERLREQLRRRQEMGQSIRRQQDGFSGTSHTLLKMEQDSDAAAEMLPISVAFAQGSPSRLLKSSRLPAQPGSGSAVRKVGPHLFHRSTSAQPKALPVSVVPLPRERSIEMPWEDLGGDRIFAQGSVGVEA